MLFTNIFFKTLDIYNRLCYYSNINIGRLAQLGERLPYKQDVVSSILALPNILKALCKSKVLFFILYLVVLAAKKSHHLMIFLQIIKISSFFNYFHCQKQFL